MPALRLKHYALICCLSLCWPVPLSAQQSQRAKEAGVAPGDSQEFTPGTTLALAGRDSELRAALAAQPTSPDLLYALAQVLEQEAKSRESLDLFTQAAKYRNPGPRELRSVAFDYVLLGDYDAATHWLEVASRMDPSDPDILYALGRCYYSNGRFLDAAAMYERVLFIQPRYLKAEENLGLAYDAINQPAKAEEALRKAAGWANPDGTDEWPFLDLGSFLLDQDRAKEAVQPLRQAARIRPRCPACHEKLGRALIATGDIPSGIGELSIAVTLDPNNPRTHYELGRAFRQSGQTALAQRELAVSQKLYHQHSQE